MFPKARVAKDHFTMLLGTLLRRYRKEKKITLRAVAEKARISEGFMSQVENNVKSPSLETLRHICQALGLSMADLLGQLENQERLVIVRKQEWEDVDVSHTGFATVRFQAPDERTVVDASVLFMEPGKSIPVRKGVKNSQEIICLLQGRLELIHGEKTIVLTEGDTVHLWTDPEKQSITNVGPDLAVVAWVGTL